MSEIIIPTKHMAAPKGQPKRPKDNILRQLHNGVFGVKHHNGEAVKDVHVLTDNFNLGLSQAMLEEARGSRVGRFLLELLASIDYAGRQNRPVMIIGRKIHAGGFRLKVVVPIDTAKRPGAPPDVSLNNGVERY